MTHRTIWSRPKMWIFPCFWKTLVLLNARSLYICNCKCRAPPLSLNKSLNNAHISFFFCQYIFYKDGPFFLDVSFFPLQLILFFDLFFSFCICAALVQDQVINFLPVGVSFRLIINQFIWIWLFLTSFRAEVCEEPAAARVAGWAPTTACVRVHTLWCFVKETSWKQTRQTGGATIASPPEPSKISRQMLNFGRLFRQLLHAFL